MWTIQHGLMLVVFMSAIWPLLLWIPRWAGNSRWMPFLSHAGRRYEQREHLYKGHRQSLRLATLLRFPVQFALRPVGRVDRWLVGAGLVRSGGIGQPTFDARWFVECEGDAAARLFGEELVEAVEALALGLEARGYRLRELRMEGLRLECLIDRDLGDTRTPIAEFVALLAPVVEALQRALEPGAKPSARPSAQPRNRTFTALLAALAALGWWGIVRSHAGPDLLEPGRALADSLWLGVPLALAVFAACWARYRNDRRGARLLGRALLIGVPAALLSGHTLLREGNVLLDRSEPQTVSLPRAQILWTRTGKNGYVTWTTLPAVPGHTSEAVDLTVRSGLVAALGLGWPPVERRVALEVDVMPGRFGYAWVRKIRAGS